MCFSATKLLPETKLVHLPYSDCINDQAQFKWHANGISGIHRKSMKNYLSFLNELAVKVIPVSVEVVQRSGQTKKKTK